MEEKYGLPFCSECNHALESHTCQSFAIFAGPQFVETLKCCYHGNMRYYLLHSIEPTLVMLLCENLVMVWKRQIAISHWVLQKHSSEDTRQIGDRNAVYFVVYFQRFHNINNNLLIII